MLVRVVPAGNVPQSVLDSIASGLFETLRVRARIMPKAMVTRDAYNHWRQQYDAEKVMTAISRSAEGVFIDKEVPTLIVTDEDLYYRGLNFVFGVEQPETSTCIVSIARLRQEFYKEHPNLTALVDRATKEAVHEIGHHIGFEHCQRTRCVMSFSGSAREIDRKEKYFCVDCRLKGQIRGLYIE